jgi:hypothetical protein
MDPRAKKGCRRCSHGGRRPTACSDYAIELGISVRKLRRLGGESRLRAMSDDARTILVKPRPIATPLERTSLKARGMKTRVPGRLTQQPQTL